MFESSFPGAQALVLLGSECELCDNFSAHVSEKSNNIRSKNRFFYEVESYTSLPSTS